MKIENDIKLDFIDVLIRPKRSTLSSRSEVSVEKTINFINSKQSWTGVPIITSNMDTVGTLEMYNKLKEYKILTCLSKHYEIEDFPEDMIREYYMLSTGINDHEWRKLQGLIQHLANFIMIFRCLYLDTWQYSKQLVIFPRNIFNALSIK